MSDQKKGSFQLLREEIEKGRNGINEGIPMGFSRLEKYVSLRRSTYYLIGGYTGSGKTVLLDDAFVLNPIEWYIKNRDKVKFSFKIVYRSMERARKFKIAKWTSRKIFLDQGIIIPIGTMLGWKGFPQLTFDQSDLIDMYFDYFGELDEIVEIVENPTNPTGIFTHIDSFAKGRGKEEQIDKYHKVYLPNDPNELILLLVDHIGLLRSEKGMNDKEKIDKASEYFRYCRDYLGYGVGVVSQLNRDISSPLRLKSMDVEPMLEDFKSSGNTQEDSDITMSLFDPMRYKVEDVSGYKLDKLKETQMHTNPGAKKYRSLKVLKNSYGADDIRIGLAMQPEVGCFKEMKKVADMLDEDYESVLNNSYFLK